MTDTAAGPSQEARDFLAALKQAPQKVIASDHGDGRAAEQMGHVVQKPPSPNTLVVDRWGKRKGREIVDSIAEASDYRLQMHLQKKVEDHRKAGYDEKRIKQWEKTWSEQFLAENPPTKFGDHQLDLLTDVHTALFEIRPVLEDTPEDVIRSKWMEGFLQSGEYHQLHAQTRMNDSTASVLTPSISKKYIEYVETLTPEAKERIQNDEETLKDETERHVSSRDAAESAGSDARDLSDACSGLGMGTPGQSVPLQELTAVYQRVKNNHELRRILEAAGRFTSLAQTMQSTKVIHGEDEVFGIDLGGEADRLIGSELCMLMDPIMQVDVMKRLVERQAIVYARRAFAKESKGPIVVCVDESGSMFGERHQTAKGLALAMGWVARHQNRWIAFVGFSGGEEGTRMCIAPGEWNQKQDQLMEWLCHFYSGGTTLDVPIVQLPEVYWKELDCPKGKTDVLLLTDDVVNCNAKQAAKFNAWKKEENVTCMTLLIGSDRLSEGGTSAISDRAWCIPSLDIESMAIKEILSI